MTRHRTADETEDANPFDDECLRSLYVQKARENSAHAAHNSPADAMQATK
jgi:hypothetical protein